jgi:hypothetical protein
VALSSGTELLFGMLASAFPRHLGVSSVCTTSIFMRHEKEDSHSERITQKGDVWDIGPDLSSDFA